MKEINIDMGETIYEAIDKLIYKGEGYYFNFNGVKVSYQEEFTEEDYYNFFRNELEDASFRETFDTTNMYRDLEKINQFINLLEDFNHNTSEEEYLDWLADYIEQGDNICVNHFKQDKNILISLKKKGFKINDFTNIKPETPREKLCWILGQVIDGLERGCVHPMCADYIRDYLKQI